MRILEQHNLVFYTMSVKSLDSFAIYFALFELTFMLAIPFAIAAETALDIRPLVGHTPLLLPSDRESSSPILPV